MKSISKRLILLVPALALFGVIACTAPAAQEPETTAPSSAPEAMATRAPAIPPPPLAEFNEQRQSIDEAWAAAHDDFDQWRAGLTMCHPATMTEALNEFALEFNTVTEAARDLTRTTTTGEFADELITAAEDEAAAFRELRDHWQPGNVALFENVEEQRSAAAQAQREAKDKALETRETLSETADPDEISDFADAFEAIETSWEDVQSEYDKLDQDDFEVEEDEDEDEDEDDEDEDDDADDDDVDSAQARARAKAVDALEALVSDSEAIVEDIEELPSLKGGRDAIKALEKALKAEADAFAAALEAAEDEEEPNFKKIDTSVRASERALDKMSDVIDDLSVEDTAGALEDITLFELEYDRLLQTWDRFHSDYNAWRADDGGCDRIEVLESLTEFSANVDAVGDSVRSLPKSGYLEPVHRLMVEAIEGEEQAFRSLRDTWQPFTLDALRAVDRARIMSDSRRSDADVIILELENRF